MAKDPSLYLPGSKKQDLNSRQQPVLQDCISQPGFPLNSSALTLHLFEKQTFPKEQISRFPPGFCPTLQPPFSCTELPIYLLNYRREIFPTNCWLQNGSQKKKKKRKQKNPKEQGASCPHMPIPAASIKGELLPQSMKPVQLINSGANCWLQMY